MSSGTNFNRKNATFTDSLGHTLGWLTQVQSQICVHTPAVHTLSRTLLSTYIRYCSNNDTTILSPASSEWSICGWLVGFFFPDLSFWKELTFLLIPHNSSNCCFTRFPHRTSLLCFKLFSDPRCRKPLYFFWHCLTMHKKLIRGPWLENESLWHQPLPSYILLLFPTTHVRKLGQTS